MRSIVFLVAMSLMLVGATFVVAIPNQAEALWCLGFDCYQSKKACEDATGSSDCFKAPKKQR